MIEIGIDNGNYSTKSSDGIYRDGRIAFRFKSGREIEVER